MIFSRSFKAMALAAGSGVGFAAGIQTIHQALASEEGEGPSASAVWAIVLGAAFGVWMYRSAS